MIIYRATAAKRKKAATPAKKPNSNPCCDSTNQEKCHLKCQIIYLSAHALPQRLFRTTGQYCYTRDSCEFSAPHDTPTTNSYFRNCRRFASARSLPDSVLAPVDAPPWFGHRPRIPALRLQGAPVRVFAPHSSPLDGANRHVSLMPLISQRATHGKCPKLQSLRNSSRHAWLPHGKGTGRRLRFI